MFTVETHVKRYQLTPRAHATLMKEINIGVMERQRDERVPKHFTMQAYSEYRAQPRAAKYNEGKIKRRGDIAPNINTGTLYKSLKYQITATQYGSKLKMRASLGKRMTPAQWAKLSPAQQAKENRKRRRLANWQKEEIARVSPAELKAEIKRQARQYKAGATGKYRRLRQRKIK